MNAPYGVWTEAGPLSGPYDTLEKAKAALEASNNDEAFIADVCPTHPDEYGDGWCSICSHYMPQD